MQPEGVPGAAEKPAPAGACIRAHYWFCNATLRCLSLLHATEDNILLSDTHPPRQEPMLCTGRRGT